MIGYLRTIVFWPVFIFLTILLALLPSSFVKPFIRCLLVISGITIEIKGRENITGIDRGQALIIAANHASFLDYFVLQAALDRPLKFIVWNAGFRMPILKTVFERSGYIGVGKTIDLGSTQKIFSSLRQGDNLVILSKASFTSETAVEYQADISRLSREMKVKILLVAIKNASKVLSLGRYRFGPGRISVNIDQSAYFGSVQALQTRLKTLIG